MAREIKFRGRKVDEPIWVYGYLEVFVSALGMHTYAIHSFSDWNLNSYTEVDEKSVGQFCGLHDKNGKEIYEGDIVQRYFTPFIGNRYKHHNPKVVEWRDSVHHIGFNIGSSSDFEVIGNIYENPNLLS